MKSIALAALLSALTAVVAHERLALDKIEAHIKTEQLQGNLQKLNEIAINNNGNRAAGYSGYDASVEYVTERARRWPDKLSYYLQPFNKSVYTVSSIGLTGPEGEAVFVKSPVQNIGTVVTGELAETPVDDVNGSLCTEAQYEGVDVAGKIALIKRGICGFITKLELAAAHGAIAVVMYNSPAGGENYTGPDLGAPRPEDIVPVGIIPLDIGQGWTARLVAGERLSVTLSVDAAVENRTVSNVVVETTEGDANNVVVLGAHLDSVSAGAGINDDGSGVSALMEIMEAFTKYQGFQNKVRFGYWGAEEDGLVGSYYYTQHLTGNESSRIRFYFNYDMIGSIEPEYSVYGVSEADRHGAQELYDYLAGQAKAAVEYGAWTNDTDYVGFLDVGVPVSGIFTGAGAPHDPCYHTACDDTDNINYEALTINAKAAARAAAKLALSLDGLPLRKRALSWYASAKFRLESAADRSRSGTGTGTGTGMRTRTRTARPCRPIM